MRSLHYCFALLCLLLLGQGGLAQQGRPVSGPLADLLGMKDSLALQEKLKTLEASEQERDLSLLQNYYRAKQNAPKMDAIAKLAEERFPDGEAAFSNALGEIYNETDGAANEKKYLAYIKRFGVIPKFAGHRFFEFAKFYVASSFANEDTAKVKYWIELITDTSYRTRAYSYGCRELVGNRQYAAAETLIRRSVADLERRGQTNTPEYFEYAKAIANVLLMNKKYEEGYRYAALAYENNKGKDKQLSQVYLNLQVATQQYQQAFPAMAESIANGEASALIKDELKNAYVTVKGSDHGLRAFADSLQAVLKAKTKAEIVEKMGTDTAYAFTLKDTEGKTVSLASLKGKVVVLDFWATWCGPCKASFPDMQKAVNKYQKDKDVAFYFIHTFEQSADPAKDAAAYIKEKQYSFRVLMDTKDPETKTNKVASGYKITGIPTKIIIDKQGKVRFRQVGNTARGEDAFLEEISSMIEMARTNS